MSKLLSPIIIRGEEIPNRVFVAPMCQYSSETEDGRFSAWHTVHYGTRAVGGAGLVMPEASAVRADGRITPWDLGMWNEGHVEDIGQLVEDFASSAGLSVNAGMKAFELHMAHGYLGCEFLSPLSNHREDQYGGSLENRVRFPLEATRAVRNAIPDSMAVRAGIGDGVHGERLGPGGVRGVQPLAQGRGRGPDRLFLRREFSDPESEPLSWLPGQIFGPHQE